MSEQQKIEIREYLREHLKVEVLDPTVYEGKWGRLYEETPTVKVRLMLEGEVLSEDEVHLDHDHGKRCDSL